MINRFTTREVRCGKMVLMPVRREWLEPSRAELTRRAARAWGYALAALVLAAGGWATVVVILMMR